MVDPLAIDEEPQEGAEAPSQMTESELAALVHHEVTNALSWDDSVLSKQRSRALEYYRGEMNDTPHAANRSEVVSTDVADTVGHILPGLMRIFGQSDRTAEYLPQASEDPNKLDLAEEQAEQATDYINYLFWHECDGYRLLYDAFWDALVVKNGIFKHWWDDSPYTEVHTHTGLTEDAYTMIAMDPNVEVLAFSERVDDELTALRQQEVQQALAGQPVDEFMLQEAMQAATVVVYDCKVQKTLYNGRLKVIVLPSEEFLINENAPSIEGSRYVGHRYRETRSNLVEQGYDPDLVYSLPAYGTLDQTDEYHARHETNQTYNIDGSVNRATELVEVIESYVQADMDGDGVAETLRVITGGPGEKQILHWEEWEDDSPFSDIVQERYPHRWQGRSLFDELEQIQRIKTILQRQALDNLYATNNPEQEVLERAIIDPDQLAERRLGQSILVTEQGAINPLVIPFTAGESYNALAYYDNVIEKRTGASDDTPTLDGERLQNQSATSAMIAQDQGFSKTELIARNFAELGGLKRLFKCLLRLVCKHQDVARVIRLRGKWVQMDPRQWNSEMDCIVNVGLGSGSRERDLNALMLIKQEQEKRIAVFGPQHSYSVDMAKRLNNTDKKIVEAAGLRNPEAYFPEVTDAHIMEAQQLLQNQEDPMDKQLQAKMAEIQSKMQIAREEMQNDIQLQREKMLGELEIAREEMLKEIALKREEMELEAGLAIMKHSETGEMNENDINIRRS